LFTLEGHAEMRVFLYGKNLGNI